MRLTAGQLRRIIKEELNRLAESSSPDVKSIQRTILRVLGSMEEGPDEDEALKAAELIHSRMKTGVKMGWRLDDEINEKPWNPLDRAAKEWVATLFSSETGE